MTAGGVAEADQEQVQEEPAGSPIAIEKRMGPLEARVGRGDRLDWIVGSRDVGE